MKKLVKSLFFIMFLTSSLFAVRDFSFFRRDKYFVIYELNALIRNYEANFSMYKLSKDLFDEITKNINDFIQLVEDYKKNESDKMDGELLKKLKMTINYLDNILDYNSTKTFFENVEQVYS
ncbi:hypothetical protein KAT08_00645 [Candidatus Babeliales bacterium]|nr:hypothetical protein [Candidatus Babeliales bacterium]